MMRKSRLGTIQNYRTNLGQKDANKSGGMDFNDKESTEKLRSTGWDLIKQIGKKILTGDFNLTTISMPIKVMLPLTILQTIAKSLFNYPVYLNIAGNQIDPLERFKFVIVASLSCFHKSSHFLKPLNPILGETYEMLWEDGSKIFLEQTSHHPPISHYYMVGPKNNYKYYGYSNFSSGAGMNSVKVNNKGKRFVEFNDGTKIMFNFCFEQYNNSLWGTIRHESLGDITYKDLTNGYECVIKFGSVKKKPSDYFAGEVKLKNIVISKIIGSYLSFIDFNNIRYWDIRENIYLQHIEVNNQPQSSSLFREDRILLGEGQLEKAQEEKEKTREPPKRRQKNKRSFPKSEKIILSLNVKILYMNNKSSNS